MTPKPDGGDPRTIPPSRALVPLGGAGQRRAPALAARAPAGLLAQLSGAAREGLEMRARAAAGAYGASSRRPPRLGVRVSRAV